MKSMLNTIVVIIIVLCLVFVVYQGYLYYQKWQQTEKSQDQILIESLKANEGMIVELSTELAEIKKRVVGDTLKETITIKEEAPTYESKKEELIELRKDPEVNAEKIEIARIELEKRINEFQESPDKILIIGKNDETYLLYRDIFGNLLPASNNIEKIIEHKDISNIPIPIEEVKLDKTKWNIKAGGYYSFDSTCGIIISKVIFSWKPYSLNASLLLSDYEDLKLAVGGDVAYEIRNNIEIGFGYSTNKEFYIKLQYQF